MTLSIAELRQVANRLIDYVEANGTTEIPLRADYYWVIPREQRIDATKEPATFTLGQLSDDVRELRRILQSETEPIAYALVWLSSVLREVGETVIG